MNLIKNIFTSLTATNKEESVKPMIGNKHGRRPCREASGFGARDVRVRRLWNISFLNCLMKDNSFMSVVLWYAILSRWNKYIYDKFKKWPILMIAFFIHFIISCQNIALISLIIEIIWAREKDTSNELSLNNSFLF